MPDNKFRINTGRLERDAGQIQNLISKMQNSINNMQAGVNQLNGMWEGASKDAFARAFMDDMNVVSDILKELKELNSFEIQAKKDYENCERQVASLVSSIKI